ncbi:MAG: Rieske (2Fe-2S) protein [Proteobacteria bacterium]|nr:Rieske (2Fe-2S) protein [Pseudomonadota bacterium]
MICELAKISAITDNIWYEYCLQSNNGLISIMLLKQNNQYIAYKNFCPHQGRRLDYVAGKFLLTPNGNILCPTHGAEFNPQSGLCISGPCVGESLQPVTIKTNEESIFTVIE